MGTTEGQANRPAVRPRRSNCGLCIYGKEAACPRRCQMADVRPLGLFDSGVGGLSVLREIERMLPRESLIYFSDSAYVPYGSRRVEFTRQRSEAITRFLLDEGAKAIVVACNTASAAALFDLR